MYTESDLLPLSALQHLAFCERQCALIHIEQAWDENHLTAQGRVLHEHVHKQEVESRGDFFAARGLRLRSLALGLTGIADMVEFHRRDSGLQLPGRKGFWQCFPVEYKRGKPKKDRCDEVQLCGQALCLEEMTGATITHGALYYGSRHQRCEVIFDEELRGATQTAAFKLHELIVSQVTPSAVHEKKCESCSLIDICMPHLSSRRTVAHYIQEYYSQAPIEPEEQKGGGMHEAPS